MKKTEISKLLISAMSALFLGACATHTDNTKAARAAWGQGSLEHAAAEIEKHEKDSADSVDALVWKLEKGSVTRASGKFDDSLKAFERAHVLIEEFDDMAETSLTEEFSAILTNQSFTDYRGYNYDRIMLSIYQAMNYIETRNFDYAQTELNRLAKYQTESERINQERIEKEEDALRQAIAKKAAEGGKAEDGNKTAEASKSIYSDYMDLMTPEAEATLRSKGISNIRPDSANAAVQAKNIYVNPFGYYLAGIFFLNMDFRDTDLEKALLYFGFTNDMVGGKSDIIAKDIKMANDMADGLKVTPVTYVVYETGMAPVREQVRIDIPSGIIGAFYKGIPSVYVNFPYVEPQKDYAKDIEISANGVKYPLETVADMDAIIKNEFDIGFPMVLTKTLISTLIKAGAEYGIYQATKDNTFMMIGGKLAANIWAASTNDADLRTWTTLPKEIRISRFDTPANGIVMIAGWPYKLEPGTSNIVFVKKTSASAAPIVRTAAFPKHKLFNSAAQPVVAAAQTNQ